jgi:hypothetical protein
MGCPVRSCIRRVASVVQAALYTCQTAVGAAADQTSASGHEVSAAGCVESAGTWHGDLCGSVAGRHLQPCGSARRGRHGMLAVVMLCRAT